MIYFDNASTTSVRTEVRRVYGQMLETCYGNPDSLHAAGRQASSLMEKSRSNIASMLHVDPSEIIFTSAASESNTLAIVGYALANEHRGHHVLTSNVEHSSVRHAMEFLKRFPFPGNVRQLENLCNWLVVMAPSQHIRVTDLPEEVRNGEAEKVHKNGEVSGSTPAGGSWEELLKGEVKEMLKNQSPDLMKQLADTFESIVIGTALEYTHGRRVDAATRLGIGRNTITRKIAEFKLESED